MIPTNAVTLARVQRTPTILEYHGIPPDSAGVPESKAIKRNGSKYGTSSWAISVSGVDTTSGPSHKRGALSTMPHPTPTAVPLASLAPVSTTFEADVVGLRCSDDDPRKGISVARGEDASDFPTISPAGDDGGDADGSKGGRGRMLVMR